MSHNLFSERINLQLFAEGGDGGSGTGAEGANGVTAGVPSLQTKGAKNPLADVKYGIQEEDSVQTADAQETTETEPVVDREAEFEKLIKGDYKDLYDAKVQNTVQNRLKSTKEQVAKIAETKMPDLNAGSLEAAISMIKGTARSMGVTVEE